MKILHQKYSRILLLTLAGFCLIATLLPVGPVSLPTAHAQIKNRADADQFFSGPVNIELLSQNQAHTAAGNSFSLSPVISANGRYVAFVSGSSDIIPNDLNGGFQDIFRRDLQTGVIDIVSVNSAGTGSGDNLSLAPLISADGRYIAFNSSASNIVPNALGGGVFVRDMQLGVTSSVSIRPGGETAMGRLAAMTPDGRYVAFLSGEPDLTPIPQPSNFNGLDLYLRDMSLGVTSMVSVNRLGTAAGDGQSGLYHNAVTAVVVSPDGRFVGFVSDAGDLVATDSNFASDFFMRDLVLGSTKLVTIDYAGPTAVGGDPAFPVMSGNGRYLAYYALSSQLVPNDANGTFDVYVYDVLSEVNTLVSVSNGGSAAGNAASRNPSITPDGRFVAFESTASNLTASADSNGGQDVFVRDRQNGSTTLVSKNRGGTNGGNRPSISPLISSDGRFVTFTSYATDLVMSPDKNQLQDVFLHDVLSGETACVSLTGPGTGAAKGQSEFPVISPDGSFVVFVSDAGNLAGVDLNATYDVFLFHNPWVGILRRIR